MQPTNFYADPQRATAYGTIGAQGTYYLVFRDLGPILAQCAKQRPALDFGCGAGRSTRFLKQFGFDVLGVDIAAEMVEIARADDPQGDYRLLVGDELASYEPASFGLIAVCWAFDNVHRRPDKRYILKTLHRLLADDGVLIMAGSTPDLYRNEWATATTRAFPENKRARSGDRVKVALTGTGDDRPYIDTLFTHRDYVELFADSGFALIKAHWPLGRPGEGIDWVSEKRLAPFFIYELEKAQTAIEKDNRP